MAIRGAYLVAVVLLAAGCTTRAAPPPPGPVWQEISLPTNASSASGATSASGASGASGRPVVRDVTACPGHGYLAGGYRAADGSTTPALWSTVDGKTWQTVAVQPKSAYGPHHLLSAVACRGDTVVAIGSTPGGVHGNLRTNTWLRTGSGPLTEVPAGFELFGGPQHIGVGQLVAGTTGWLIGGARTDANGSAGAAVWSSPDGAAFQLVDNDPALESDTRAQTVLTGVAALPSGGFVAVGSAIPAGDPATRQPLAWHSPDGLHWTRQVLPSGGEDADVEAVTAYHDGLLALGIRGGGFGAWLGSATGWRPVARFGTLNGSALPQITSLVITDGAATTGGAVATGGAVTGPDAAWAVGSDGTRYRLWRATDPAAAWTGLDLPAPVPAGGAGLARLASVGGRLVLATDGVPNRTESRVWTYG